MRYVVQTNIVTKDVEKIKTTSSKGESGMHQKAKGVVLGSEAQKIPTILSGKSLLSQIGLRSLLSASRYNVLDVNPELCNSDEINSVFPSDGSVIVLIESSGEDLKSLTNINRMRDFFTNGKIIVLAIEPNETHFHDCFNAGVGGYILPDGTADVLFETMHLVWSGQKVFPSKYSSWLKNNSGPDALQGKSSGVSINDFKDREVCLLQMLVAGMSNKEISKYLNLSDANVKVLLQKVLKKIDGRNRVHGAVWGVNHGLKPYTPGNELPARNVSVS